MGHAYYLESYPNPTMTDLTKRLPIELLAEIVGYASALDILRFKQVGKPLLIFRRVDLTQTVLTGQSRLP